MWYALSRLYDWPQRIADLAGDRIRLVAQREGLVVLAP